MNAALHRALESETDFETWIYIDSGPNLEWKSGTIAKSIVVGPLASELGEHALVSPLSISHEC